RKDDRFEQRYPGEVTGGTPGWQARLNASKPLVHLTVATILTQSRGRLAGMRQAPNSQLRRLTLAYTVALILLIVAADRGVLATSYLAGLPAADKIGHFLLFGLLSYLANSALGGQLVVWQRLEVPKGSALVCFVVALEELSQLWIVHRNFDLTDLAADLAGIWIFGRLALIRLTNKIRHRESGACKARS
ncbi:MAG: VanZ family protein, partial [Acidobacteriota bacterium]